MRVRYAAYWLQKRGNEPAEYEDAFAPDAAALETCAEFRCAVADGATETSFSGLWAQILTRASVQKRLASNWKSETQVLAAEWDAHIAEKTREKPLPWYAEEKLRRGAFSSLLSLRLKDNGQWNGFCIGDSCAFHVRGGEIRTSFPYQSAAQFTNSPALISSIPAQNAGLRPSYPRGTWQYGDGFYLMTDALAQCFLADSVFRDFVLTTFSADSFTDAIQALWRDKRCRNDDVTLLKVQLVPGEESGGLA
jgi:hypothetical protein